MFGISRIDDERKHQHAWFVRLGYQRINKKSRPQFIKSFSDKKYGGCENALLAAKVFRDEKIGFMQPLPVRLQKFAREERWERRDKALAQGMRRVVVGIGVEGDRKARELGVGSSYILSRIRNGRQDSVCLMNHGGYSDYVFETVQTRRDKKRIVHARDNSTCLDKRAQSLLQGLSRVEVGTGVEGCKKAIELGIFPSSSTLYSIRYGKQSFINLHNLGGRYAFDESRGIIFLGKGGRYKIDPDEQWERRKQALDAGLKVVVVGTGKNGLEKAKQLGVVGKKLLSQIFRGKKDRVHLQFIGDKKYKFEIISHPFRNEITQDTYARASRVIERQCHSINYIDKHEIIQRAVLVYASEDLRDKSETYLEKLTSIQIKFFYKTLHSKKRNITLDINGNVEQYHV